MQREIKFRGKRVDNQEWVCGSLVIDRQGIHSIIDWADSKTGSYSWNDITPESVGQYTGLKDRHGVEIYEEDIVRAFASDGNYSHDVIGEVKYGGLSFAYVGKRSDGEKWFDTITNPNIERDNHIEVIGNIHSNPELLKESV